MNNIIIIGGDKRQKELLNILSKQGYRCRYINSNERFENEVKIGTGDIIILPVPLSKDGEVVYSSDSNLKIKIKDVFTRIDSSNFIFGGNISKAVEAYLTEKNISFFDYLSSEEFVVYNAYLTGLGAVKLLSEETDCDIRNKKVLITGFGKVGRFTAQAMLKAGCDVYVSARNSFQLNEAECIGCKVIEFNKKGAMLFLFDYIFNTVPENIFTSEDISHIKGKYFELASAPFGVRRELFAGRENKYFFGSSLPGRYLSYSAAEKLAEFTVKHINSRNGGD